MKILHTADWHLGKHLGKQARLAEQQKVLEEITAIAAAEEVDAVLIAGDIFDTFNPSIEATALLFKTLKALSREGACAVVAIAGNHDSPDRIQAPEVLARECGIILFGYPYTQVQPFSLENGLAVRRTDKGLVELTLPNSDAPLRLIVTPYANEQRLKTYLEVTNKEASLKEVLHSHWQRLADQYCDGAGVNMLMAHLFMLKKGETLEEDLEEEKSILYVGGSQALFSEMVPAQLHYVALGHLHRHFFVDQSPCPIAYSSSPLAYSFAEANQQKYVLLIEATPQQPVTCKRLPLKSGKSLQRVTFEEVEKAIAWLEAHPDTWVELTMVSDTYLSAKDRKRLYKAHKGIVSLVPSFKEGVLPTQNAWRKIDLTKDIETLFVDFFKYKNEQQTPNKPLLEVFKEVINQ